MSKFAINRQPLSPQKVIIMMPYLSYKKIENDVYNFPTWQYYKYKDIFDNRIIIKLDVKRIKSSIVILLFVVR